MKRFSIFGTRSVDTATVTGSNRVSVLHRQLHGTTSGFVRVRENRRVSKIINKIIVCRDQHMGRRRRFLIKLIQKICTISTYCTYVDRERTCMATTI